MSRSVMVAAIDAEDGKLLMVVVCPTEAYASKNQKHLGFIKEGQLVPEEKVVISEKDSQAIAETYAILQPALTQLLNQDHKS